MSDSCASRSTILPLPSSPHCAPTTTVAGTSVESAGTVGRLPPLQPQLSLVRSERPRRRSSDDDAVAAAARHEADVGLGAQRSLQPRRAQSDRPAVVAATDLGA